MTLEGVVIVLAFVLGHVLGIAIGIRRERRKRQRIDAQRRHHWRPTKFSTFDAEIGYIDRQIVALFRKA